MKKIYTLLCLALSFTVSPAQAETIAAAMTTHHLEGFATLFAGTGVQQLLNQNKAYTIFAVSDAGLGNVPINAAKLAENPQGKEAIGKWLQGYIVDVAVTSEGFQSHPTMVLRSLAGTEIRVKTTPMGMTANGISMGMQPIISGNTVIYILNKPLP